MESSTPISHPQINLMETANLPPNLKPYLSNQETPWYVSSEIYNRCKKDLGNANYLICPIEKNDPEYLFIAKYFFHNKPSNRSIKQVHYIHNPILSKLFQTHIEKMEKEAENKLFQPLLKKDTSFSHRKKILLRYEKITQHYSPFYIRRTNRIITLDKVKILPLFQGTTAAKCKSIANTGFASFGNDEIRSSDHNLKTDEGYFGNGIYFTNNARYADLYSKDGNLLVSWVSMREPYPIVADIFTQNAKDMQRFKGNGKNHAYNAHFIPVVCNRRDKQGNIYLPCTEYDTQTNGIATHIPDLDELVVFEGAQTLPSFWIELQIDMVKQIQNFTNETLFNRIQEALNHSSIKNNAIVYDVLDKKSKELIALPLQDPLNEENRILCDQLYCFLKETGNRKNTSLIHLENYSNIQKQIGEKKIELESLQKKDLVKYPHYYNELLERKYIHLYDHLIEMSHVSSRSLRKAIIENYDFSKISHIVLETRKAIIQKVEESISNIPKNLIFLIGNTGAGKTTTLCFLRGDEMIKIGNDFDSAQDTDRLIGHEANRSRTFLPIIASTDELTIVDFLGFEDSNGILISLGMECALKALITKYQPRILILDSITNIEGKFAAAEELGMRLDRIIPNKNECILGITKYSKDPDYIAIETIKLLQEKDKTQLLQQSDKEKEMLWKLKQLTKKCNRALKPEKKSKLSGKILKLEEKYQKIKEEREKTSLISLETKEQQIHKLKIEEKEKELLRQMGLTQSISFSNLDDPKHLSEILERLLLLKPITCQTSSHIIESSVKEFLQKRFHENLIKKIAIEENCQEVVQDYKLFAKNTLEYSLIYSILKDSYPEIGEFLHLPEIDPEIVRDFDKVIVGDCIHNCIKSVITNINMNLIDKVIYEFGHKANSEKVNQLKERLDTYKQYILGLLGALPKEKETIDDAWACVRISSQATISKAEREIKESWELPSLAKIVLGVPLGIPLGVYQLYRYLKEQEEIELVTQQTINHCLDDYMTTLDHVHTAIITLKEMEKIIEKGEEITNACEEGRLSLKSFNHLDESVEKTINEVRRIYGEKDWDQLVFSFREKVSQTIETTDDILPLLYLRQDPSIKMIKITSNTLMAEKIVRESRINNKEVMLFDYPEINLIMIIKRCESSDEILDLLSDQLDYNPQEGIESSSEIEIIDIQTITTLTNLTQNKSHSINSSLTDFAKKLEIDLQKPLFQILLSAVVKPEVRLDNRSFLKAGLVEKSTKSFQVKFGKSQWEYHYGDIGTSPVLRPDIEQILNSDSIIFPGQKIKDAFLLVLIPEMVQGIPFTLNHHENLIQNPKNGYEMRYRNYSNYVKDELGKHSTKSRWILMSRNVIPNSRNKTYEQQVALVNSCAQQSRIPFDLPEVLEVVTTISVHFVETGEYLYADNRAGNQLTNTRCKGKVNKQWPPVVGNFSSSGLNVCHCELMPNNDYYNCRPAEGVGVVWRL